MSSQLPDDPKRDAFLAAADQMGEHESMFDAFCVEPWPGWFLKVVLRMGQVFAPELRPTDLREHPERFFAIVAGVNLSLIKAAEKLDLTQLPDEPICNLVRKELELIKTDETARFKETQNRAVDLPGYEAMGFSVALGETVKRKRRSSPLNGSVKSPRRESACFSFSPGNKLKAAPSATLRNYGIASSNFGSFQRVMEVIFMRRIQR